MFNSDNLNTFIKENKKTKVRFYLNSECEGAKVLFKTKDDKFLHNAPPTRPIQNKYVAAVGDKLNL